MSDLISGSIVEVKQFVMEGLFCHESWRPAIVMALEPDKMRVKFWRSPEEPETYLPLSERGRMWR